MKINFIDASNDLNGSKDILILKEAGIQYKLMRRDLIMQGDLDKIDPGENRVVVRKSSGSDLNNITKPIRGERERVLISIKMVKPRVNPCLALLKIAPSMPIPRLRFLLPTIGSNKFLEFKNLFQWNFSLSFQ